VEFVLCIYTVGELGLWIVFLTMEPDILVGVKLLHTVIVGGDDGLSSGAMTTNMLRVD
jgi:hypothetical protein